MGYWKMKFSFRIAFGLVKPPGLLNSSKSLKENDLKFPQIGVFLSGIAILNIGAKFGATRALQNKAG